MNKRKIALCLIQIKLYFSCERYIKILKIIFFWKLDDFVYIFVDILIKLDGCFVPKCAKTVPGGYQNSKKETLFLALAVIVLESIKMLVS